MMSSLDEYQVTLSIIGIDINIHYPQHNALSICLCQSSSLLIFLMEMFNSWQGSNGMRENKVEKNVSMPLENCSVVQ